MPGKELIIDNGEVREADREADREVDPEAPRKFYRCPYCDAVRGTAAGMETHLETKHSEAQ